MPEYNITIGDQAYQITLIKKSEKGDFEAEINGRPVELKLEPRADRLLTMNITIEERTYSVELEKLVRHQPFSLRVNGKPFVARIRETVKKAPTHLSEAKSSKEAEGPSKPRYEAGVITSPMAGKIVSVNVKEGDKVKNGDVVCILEAMKMENEIAATKTGKVEEVSITEGMPVNKRDVLIRIK